MNEKYNVYLVSDSTGETLDRIFLSLKSQFANFDYEKKEFAFIRTEQQIDKIIKECNVNKDQTYIRINNNSDLEFVTSEKFPGIFLPFTETKKQLIEIDILLKKTEKLKTDIIPILESINGLANLEEICSFSERIKIISFGSHDLAKSISNSLAKNAICIEIDGELRDLSYLIENDAVCKIFTKDDQYSLDTLRHSTAHVLAQAVLNLYPGTEFAVGPSIDDGFYYDFLFKENIKESDLIKIENEMRRISKSQQDFVRKEITKDQAHKMFSKKSLTY